MKTPLRTERALIPFTILFLAIYVPVETYVSLGNLLSPFYLVDLIGMALLAAGVLRYRLDNRSAYAPILVAGYAWTGANFWRAMADRLRLAEMEQAGWTQSDSPRIILVGGVLILLASFGTFLAIHESGRRQA